MVRKWKAMRRVFLNSLNLTVNYETTEYWLSPSRLTIYTIWTWILHDFCSDACWTSRPVGLPYLSLKKKVSPLIWATASNTTGSEQMSMGVTGPWVGGRGLPPVLIPGVGRDMLLMYSTRRGEVTATQTFSRKALRGLLSTNLYSNAGGLEQVYQPYNSLVAAWSKRLHSWLGCDLGWVSREGEPCRKK